MTVSRSYLLLAATALATAGISAASAADLPMRSAPPAPYIAAVPVFTWTGFYVGAQVGYGWNANENDIVLPTGFVVESGDFGDSGDGFLAGVHAGYNYQIGSFVVGLEGDIEGVFGDDDDDLVIVGPGGVFTNTASLATLSTGRARSALAPVSRLTAL
jgi:outer membrane immunogenic protein